MEEPEVNWLKMVSKLMNHQDFIVELYVDGNLNRFRPVKYFLDVGKKELTISESTLDIEDVDKIEDSITEIVEWIKQDSKDINNIIVELLIHKGKYVFIKSAEPISFEDGYKPSFLEFKKLRKSKDKEFDYIG